MRRAGHGAAPAPAAVVAPMEPVDDASPEVAPEAEPILAQEVRVEVEPEAPSLALAERRHAEGQKHPPPRVVQRVIPPWDQTCCPPYGAPAFDFELV